MTDQDPYSALRTSPPPEADEVCACNDTPPLMLIARLIANPVACARCLCEVSPERNGYSPELTYALASWNGVATSLMRLWLDSGQYETWAAAELEGPSSAVNVRALELVRRLRAVRETYYWWFQAVTPVELDWKPPAGCPVCAGPIHSGGPNRHFAFCEPCGVAIEILDVSAPDEEIPPPVSMAAG